MIIKNFEQLASSGLRRQLLQIAEAGFEAVNTKTAIEKSFEVDRNGRTLTVLGKKFDLGEYKRVFLLAFGKAAFVSAGELGRILGNHLHHGVVIDVNVPQTHREHRWERYKATHPLTSEDNVIATKGALGALSGITGDDLVICSTSGGGSAIFELPYKIEPEKSAGIFKAMTKGGATISELNTVRKHTSLVKGGQLAKHLYPATVINLLFSDVPGNDLSVIASGPLIEDTTTVNDAKNLLNRFDVLKIVGLDKVDLVETPKEEKYFEKVNNFLVVAPNVALKAMKEKAEVLGWNTKIWNDKYQGEARILGPQIASANQKGECLLGAGESTVKILGKGTGGRNQEMALSALSIIGENQVMGCFASDGHDNSDCAGAIVDTSTKNRSLILNLQSEIFLNNNDSFAFFDAVGDHVITDLTGSNVADFFICLKS